MTTRQTPQGTGVSTLPIACKIPLSLSPRPLGQEGRRLGPSEGIGKEAASEQGHRKAIYWLTLLALLISLLVGTLCIMESVTPRTDGNGQLDLAAEGAPTQVEVTIGEAIQALGVRH